VFGYDALNRLLTAESTSTYATSPSHCWGEKFVYDNQSTGTGPWGNLTNINVSQSPYNGCTQENLSSTATAKNQLAEYCFDAAGNLILNATCPAPPFTPTYNYNAENQLISTAGVTYTYDGDGKRVQKSNGKLYWYGLGSDPLVETDPSGNIPVEYVFFGGKRIARRDSGGAVSYYLADHLGTSRIVTNSTGTVQDDADFYPFGKERPYLSSSGNTYKFTGKERDAESGLDNFGARYYSSSMGRFMSVDPAGLLAVNFENPQTLNLYGYTMNNPLRYTDPTGMYVCKDSAKCDSQEDKDFETARQHDLQSKNADERRAAAAYGDPGVANGVSVSFVDTLPDNKAGDVKIGLQGNADESYTATADVRILKGQGVDQLEQTLGHEGSHIADAQAFTNNLRTLPADSPLRIIFPQGVSNIPSLNVTQYWTELRAYYLQAQIARRQNEPLSLGGNKIRPGDLDADKIQAINRFLRDSPVYRVTPQSQGPKQFPEFP
jgi:RHS repeat-associated protein